MSAASSLVTILFMTTVSFVGRGIGAGLLASKPFNGLHLAEPLLQRFGWRAAPARACRHIAVDNANSCDLRALTNRNVGVQADTGAQHNKVLKCRTAGNSRLSNHNTMPPNAHIVAYLDQIVDLGPSPMIVSRIAPRSTVVPAPISTPS